MTRTGSRTRQAWQTGDVFAVPLLDGTVAFGQVLAARPEVLNSVAVALFARRSDSLSRDNCFATLLVTRDLLDSGVWKIQRNAPVQIPEECFPYENTRSNGWVGAKVTGTRNVGDFVNAFFGLSPWDQFYEPDYLDKLLLPPERRPANVILAKARLH